jgi:hypothetical protein
MRFCASKTHRHNTAGAPDVDRDCPRTGEAEGVGPIVRVWEVGEVGGGGAVELSAVLEVEEAVGLGQVADGADEGLKGLGVEEGDFKSIAGVEGALSQGVLSMNQPRPLASVSRVRVPEVGRPMGSKPVILASASWPVGRSVISILRLNGVVPVRNSVQVGIVVFWRLKL